jgi:hypothetical protein
MEQTKLSKAVGLGDIHGSFEVIFRETESNGKASY